jgi:arabinose-5-phosphate isomerase
VSSKTTDSLIRGKEVIRIEAEELSRLADRIGEEFSAAVDLIYERTRRASQATGKAVLTGIGKSGLVCQKIAATLASTGTPALFLHPTEGMHGDLGIVQSCDVALIASYSGETAEILQIIPSLRRMGVPIIGIAGNRESTLARLSDIVLDVNVEREACALGLAPTASTTATLALGDALAVSLIERRGFTDEDFALLHPGGSIGQRLTVRIGDVMHSGDALPLLVASKPMSDAIPYVSEKRLGITGVIDDDGKLIGVLTDGDIRRSIEKEIVERQGQLFDQPVSDFMGNKPKTIHAEALIGTAINICEKHNITALFVTDKEDRPVGIIHLHDLLRA